MLDLESHLLHQGYDMALNVREAGGFDHPNELVT
jgi:hypothetical protein